MIGFLVGWGVFWLLVWGAVWVAAHITQDTKLEGAGILFTFVSVAYLIAVTTGYIVMRALS